MFVSLYTLSAISLVLAAVLGVKSFIARLRNAAKAKRLGCQPLIRIPHPFWDPLNVRETVKAMKMLVAGDYMQWWSDLLSKRSTVQLQLLAQDEIYTSDPKNVQTLLATKFDDFGIEAFRGPMVALLGHGIFTSDGDRWARSRAMLRPAFTRDQVSDLRIEEKHCSNMLKALSIGNDGWTPVINVGPIFYRQTMDRSTEFLFGESVDSQLTALHDRSETKITANFRQDFAAAFDASTEFTLARFVLGDLYWLMDMPAFRKWNRTCHDLIDHYVHLALSGDIQRHVDEKGTADKYILLKELVEQTRDPMILRDELINILLAGRDTTAGALCYMFSLFASNPQVFRKLRKHIIADFGEYDPNDYESITFESLKSCQYLQYCLNEMLRIYPQVPWNARRATCDTTLPQGGGPDGLSPVFVPAGKTVLYSVFVMHRDKAVWGDDVEEFRPERWSGRKVGWEYLPFNGGPRICIGQQFALTSLGFTLVRMLQQFDQVVHGGPEPAKPMKQVVKLTSVPFGGVPLRFHQAS